MTQDNLLGKTINGHEIVGIIGHGGMATVYRARQMSMDRIVAMKVLPRQFVDDDTYIQRFNREVNIVSRLEHRSIVPVYDHGEHDRQPYIAMRYMPAGSVDERIADGSLTLERIAEIMRQIAPALDYAHTKNVLHRDLKPSNVLLDDDGGAYLTDFGIARILGEAAGSTITTQGVVGTPAYMSPEQAQGLPLDNRSDIYSLGVMLFEMVTGRRPFESDTPYGVAVMQVTTPPPQPRQFKADLSLAIERVLFKSMEKHPDQRYQTAEALAEAFIEALSAPPESVNDTQPRRAHTGGGGDVRETQPAPQQPANFTPPPYSAPANRPPSNAGESAWMPPVAPKSGKRRRVRRTSPLVSVMLGGLIGCALLTLLVAVTAVLIGNLDSIFDAPTDPPAITATVTATPADETENSVSSAPPTDSDDGVRIIPSNTPRPTETAFNVTVIVRTATTIPTEDTSNQILPPGVRTPGD